MALKLMYITNDLDVAMIAQKYGVDRIWIDLETIGKEDRQKGMNTVKSNHTISDISKIKPYLTTSQLLVRVNPWHSESRDEINSVIEAGADLIMLPYWKTLEEVELFCNAVNGRCKTILLLETKEAVEIIDDVLALACFDEIHIGLNDLHLSYGMTFMFELLANGLVESLCRKFYTVGVPYGFGGIAKLGEGLLPAEKVIMEHYRLGSSRVILSRTFCDYQKYDSLVEIDSIFHKNIQGLRKYEESLVSIAEEVLLQNKLDVVNVVEDIVLKINSTII